MRAQSVLVAFASQSGSTAGIAEAVAVELRAAGLAVDCRPAASVASLQPYAALILGSGVFLRGRASDGGGFLAHHAASVRERPVWLFCAGPIGRGRSPEGTTTGSPAVDVARAIGARGAAAFGALTVDRDAEAFDRIVDMRRVREWARGIAAELGRSSLAAAS